MEKFSSHEDDPTFYASYLTSRALLVSSLLFSTYLLQYTKSRIASTEASKFIGNLNNFLSRTRFLVSSNIAFYHTVVLLLASELNLSFETTRIIRSTNMYTYKKQNQAIKRKD